jgi:DNA-binding transcriptional MerR regulator
MGGAFPIGEVARRAGLKVPTIRYYEQIGLLPPLPRSEGNRRCYHDSDVRRLVFIRHARELGFDVEAIRSSLCRTSRRTLAGRLMRLSASISRPSTAEFNGSSPYAGNFSTSWRAAEEVALPSAASSNRFPTAKPIRMQEFHLPGQTQ